MKRKGLIAVATAVAALTATSCGTLKVNQRISQARMLPVHTTDTIVPVLGRLQVNPERIEAVVAFKASEVKALGNSIDSLKKRAVFKILQDNHADELVAPLFDIETYDNGSCNVTVRGYLGSFIWE